MDSLIIQLSQNEPYINSELPTWYSEPYMVKCRYIVTLTLIDKNNKAIANAKVQKKSFMEICNLGITDLNGKINDYLTAPLIGPEDYEIIITKPDGTVSNHKLIIHENISNPTAPINATIIVE